VSGYVISSSYGNDSLAMIQWAREAGLQGVTVLFVDTGWSAPGWLDRVTECERWVSSVGFRPVRIKSPMSFAELMRHKGGFPSQRYQWCSGILKGLPFLGWIDENDSGCKSIVMVGVRREESLERAETPEFVHGSEYHGGRTLWHPLYLHDTSARNELLARAGFAVLPHRSKECSPCINANRKDLRQLDEPEIARVEELEDDVGNVMFRAKRHGGAHGIRRVIAWAYAERGKYDDRQETLFSGCSSGYCGS
jgi:3'-phosphoadenosine 5'-phosphosulfate sulfotransferase (PAPS reductase)/FAD synthetase